MDANFNAHFLPGKPLCYGPDSRGTRGKTKESCCFCWSSSRWCFLVNVAFIYYMRERERERDFGSLSNINLGSGHINHFWNFPVFSCSVFFSYIVSGIIFITFFFTADNMVIWETLDLFFTPLLFVPAVIGHVTILWLFGFSYRVSLEYLLINYFKKILISLS